MPPRVTVLLTPGGGAVPPGATAVVVDVLRATSSLTTARAHGAAAVLPVATPEEAFALRARQPEALLCGEREGRRIEGFDLGNSPLEYRPEVVGGRTLIFASTNGSLALLAAARARERLLGAFVNAGAVARRAARASELAIVCSGKLGRFCLEDAAFAGWLCARLEAEGARLANPAARLARALAPADEAAVRATVQGAAQGRYLRTLGLAYAADVAYCAELDLLDEVWSL